MIHIIIGTKAQLIKMSPLIRQLKQQGIRFNLIDLGQHSLITKALREEFDLDEPGFYFSKGSNITTMTQALAWLIKIFFKSLSSSRIKKEVFLNQEGICLIHGDTISTVIGLYLAKRAKLRVAHIEAGLRSHCWHEPFPEEILRIITMRFSDILFVPSQWAYHNLTMMGMQKKAILVCGNTGREAVLFSLSKNTGLNPDFALGFEENSLNLCPDKACEQKNRRRIQGNTLRTLLRAKRSMGKDLEVFYQNPNANSGLNLALADFALLTCHRIENIFSKKRLRFIIEIIKTISYHRPLVFILHHPTVHQLKKFSLWTELKEIRNVHFFKILSHRHFIQLLIQCSMAITDGGSIQEEAFYLGKPCLLLRRHTERNEGIGENAVLSRFNKETIAYFLHHHQEFKRNERVSEKISPSSEIIAYLKRHA